jgi:hypothetical protein
MRYLPHLVLGALLLGTLAPLGGTRAALADPPPPRAEAERWIGLRVTDPDLRLRAVADTKGPLNEVADAIPFLVIALDDESPPVQAAARERLRELAGEAVTPILDALQAARPGRKSGAFGALSALGTTVTPLEIAAAAGGLAPVNPPDRREAALVLALPVGTPTSADRARLGVSLRLAALLLADTDAQVRRTAAAALALVALQHVRATDAARTDPALRRGLRLSLAQGQRERIAELMGQGGADIAVAAAGLASRFEDASETVLAALVKMLDKEDRRDAAALALADLGAVSAVPQLVRHASFGTWRALLRLGQGDDVVLKAFKSSDKPQRRLAAAAALAEHRGGAEAVEAMLPELAEALEDGAFADVEPWLRRLAEWGREGRPALPLLQAFVEKEGGEPESRNLAAAVAFGIDRDAAWAAKRVELLLAQADEKAPPDPHHELAVATALAAYYEGLTTPPATAPLALSPRRLTGLTLTGRVVVASVAVFVGRADKPGPHLALVLGVFGGPGAPLSEGPPTLRDFAQRGLLGDDTVVARWLALTVLAVVPDVSAEHRKLVEALLSARDPWLRHPAARVLRMRWPA